MPTDFEGLVLLDTTFSKNLKTYAEGSLPELPPEQSAVGRAFVSNSLAYDGFTTTAFTGSTSPSPTPTSIDWLKCSGFGRSVEQAPVVSDAVI